MASFIRVINCKFVINFSNAFSLAFCVLHSQSSIVPPGNINSWWHVIILRLQQWQIPTLTWSMSIIDLVMLFATWGFTGIILDLCYQNLSPWQLNVSEFGLLVISKLTPLKNSLHKCILIVFSSSITGSVLSCREIPTI